MDSFDNASLHALTDEQIERLAAVVLDEFGRNLTRIQFNDVVLTLFEDIAGFETVPRERMARYLKVPWVMYRRSITSSRMHQSRARSPVLSRDRQYPESFRIVWIPDRRVAQVTAPPRIEFSAFVEEATWKKTRRIATSETTTRRTDASTPDSRVTR